MSLTESHPDFSFAQHSGFEKTSESSWEYNCIAWAAEDVDRYWWPDRHYYWPPGIPLRETLQAFVDAFSTLGYDVCRDESLEPGFEKIAIFSKDGTPKHAARQIVSGPLAGRWTSKMGQDIDIAHDLQGVSGPLYGSVSVIMRRQID